MTDFDKQIQQAQEQMERKAHLERIVNSLADQRRELDRRIISLRVEMRDEQADVDKLEQPSLTTFFYNLMGKLEDKLETERQQAQAAAIRHDSAVRELAALDADLSQYRQELYALAGCDRRYKQLMEDKRNVLKRAGSPVSERILALTDQIGQCDRFIRELEEAVTAGRRAKSTANGVLSKLDTALDYSTWDMAGGGLWADLAKHDVLKEAQNLVNTLQSNLRKFKTELTDVSISADLQVTVDGFLHFSDYFFDGLFVDWAVRDRIKEAQSRVQSTAYQIDRVLNEMNNKCTETTTRKAVLQSQLEDLVKSTPL